MAISFNDSSLVWDWFFIVKDRNNTPQGSWKIWALLLMYLDDFRNPRSCIVWYVSIKKIQFKTF